MKIFVEEDTLHLHDKRWWIICLYNENNLKNVCLKNDGLEQNVLTVSDLIRYLPKGIRQSTLSYDR